jgi:hypothetical protein
MFWQNMMPPSSWWWDCLGGQWSDSGKEVGWLQVMMFWGEAENKDKEKPISWPSTLRRVSAEVFKRAIRSPGSQFLHFTDPVGSEQALIPLPFFTSYWPHNVQLFFYVRNLIVFVFYFVCNRPIQPTHITSLVPMRQTVKPYIPEDCS